MLVELQSTFNKYDPGTIKNLPWPQRFDDDTVSKIEALEDECARVTKSLSIWEETDPSFIPPYSSVSLQEGYAEWRRQYEHACEVLLVNQAKISRLVDQAYGIESSGVDAALWGEEFDRITTIDECSCSEFALAIVSWAVGAALGRWSLKKKGWEPTGIFDEQAFVATCDSECESKTVLVDDEGHDDDLLKAVENSFRSIWAGGDVPISRQVAAELSKREDDLRPWLGKTFFQEHVAIYSMSFRKAPIYWQLATASASYSVWLYYHRFTKDTFFQVLNDYVKPKLNYERQKLERVRSEGGTEPARSQRKEIEDQEKIVAELAAMAEEIERIAPLWNPNLNDGVIINFAPLWRLVPQNKSWQKECKNCWDKLVKGEYDWAHLAMHLWPERVVPKCVTDASLAIAHCLEDVFWEQDDRDRFQPKEEPQGGWALVIKKLVVERTSPAVKAALESLLTAPAPAGNSRSRRRRTGQ